MVVVRLDAMDGISKYMEILFWSTETILDLPLTETAILFNENSELGFTVNI